MAVTPQAESLFFKQSCLFFLLQIFHSRHSGQVVKNECCSEVNRNERADVRAPHCSPAELEISPWLCTAAPSPHYLKVLQPERRSTPLCQTSIAYVMQITFFFRLENIANLRLRVRSCPEDPDSRSYYILSGLLAFKSELPGFPLAASAGSPSTPSLIQL